MNKNMIILIGILLLWLLVIRPLSSKNNENTSEISENEAGTQDESLTYYDDNNYVNTAKNNNTTFENSDDLKVGGNTYTK